MANLLRVEWCSFSWLLSFYNAFPLLLFFYCLLCNLFVNLVEGITTDPSNSNSHNRNKGDNDSSRVDDEGQYDGGSKSDIDIIIPVAVLGVIIHTIIGHTAEQNRGKHPLLLFLSDSVVAICLGMVAALILKACNKGVIEFNKDIFWYCVLPPIILAQGYTLRKRNFFRLFSAIFLFGVLGTFLNFLSISYFAYNLSQVEFIRNEGCTSQLFGGAEVASSYNDGDVDGNNISISNSSYVDDGNDELQKVCLENFTPLKAALLGAILSASDGVAALVTIEPEEFPRLGAIILGENVLNEAISLLLFRALYEDYENEGENTVSKVSVFKGGSVLLAAVVIGMICGLLPSRLFTIQQSYKVDSIKQCVLVLLFAYFSYVLSEAFEFSGTLAILFCSLTIAHYSSANLSSKSKYITKGSFKMLAAIADAFSFVYIGLTVISLNGHYNLYFSFFLFLAICISRIVNIYILVVIGSFFNRSRKKTAIKVYRETMDNGKSLLNKNSANSDVTINYNNNEDIYIKNASEDVDTIVGSEPYSHSTNNKDHLILLDGRPSPANSISSSNSSEYSGRHPHANFHDTKRTLMTILESQYSGKVIPLNHREIVAFAVAGMIRGNVSWAQALQVRQEDHIIASTTLTVVLATIFLFQIILPLVVKLLGLKPDEEGGEEVRKEEEKEKKLQGEYEKEGEKTEPKRGKDKKEISRNLKERERERAQMLDHNDELDLTWERMISEQKEEEPTPSKQGFFMRILSIFQSLDKNYMRPYFSGIPPTPSSSPSKAVTKRNRKGETYVALMRDGED